MPFFPYNTNLVRRGQSDAAGILTGLLNTVVYAPGSPVVLDDDYFVASANMKVGAYTLLLTAMPEAAIARRLLITVTQVGGVDDTMGTLTIVGTDIAGNALTESVAPVANSTKLTLNAFKTVSSITGVGWVINTGNDTIKVGTSDSIGLPDKLSDTAQVLYCSVNNVKEATAPTVTVDAAVLAKNTVDPNTALGGTPFKVYYVL